MSHLPPTQAHLQRHRNKPSNTNPPTITNRHRTQTELPLLPLHPIADLRKRIHIHRTAQQALPEHNRKNDPHARYDVEQTLPDQDGEIYALEQGGEVEVVESEEGGGGAGDEDAGLVDGVVGGVEGAVVGEGGGGEGEEEGGGHALVYGVFGYVDEEEGEHAAVCVLAVLRGREGGGSSTY